MVRHNKQRGASLLGLLIVVVVGGFFLLLGVRLVPVYLEYFTVKSIAQSVAEDRALSEASIQEINEALKTQMQLNEVRRDREEIFQVERRSGGGVALAVDYERREPLLANVDLVITFERTF